MELKLITLKEYLQLEDTSDYDFFMRYSTTLNQPEDRFQVGDLMEKPFGIVKDLQHDLVEGIPWTIVCEYIIKLSDHKLKYLEDLRLDEFCQGWKYIRTEIERISEIETITLGYVATDEEIRAGIGKLGVLGVYLQFRSIAQSLGYSIDQVKAMRYDEAYLELVTQKLLNEYEREIIKIRGENRK